MASTSDRTEQPTQRRERQAREKGQFPSSRELLTGIQFLTCLFLISAWGTTWLEQLRIMLGRALTRAAEQSLEPRHFVNLIGFQAAAVAVPLLQAGGLLVAVTIAVQLASTRMGISLHRLAPSFERFQPLKRFRQLPAQNLPLVLNATVVIAVFAWTVYWVATDQLPQLILMSLSDLSTALRTASGLLFNLLWRAGLLLLGVGLFDYARQYKKNRSELRMTRQEVRDEMKESEGNPLIKMRIRRLQREMRRMRMMQEVARATAVIVNPTHYAIALRYRNGEMVAPVVVGKGRGYIALTMRRIAEKNRVPIVENPPLARTLYRSVEIGQEIPPALYRAVAEILAYVYRIMSWGGSDSAQQ